MQTAETTIGAKRFFILTGGPGSGKTTLLDALEKRGYSRTIEAGRSIIQEQMSIGGHALPWDDSRLFAELMFDWEMRSYRMAEKSHGFVFFDRGVPDVVAYLRLVGEAVPEYMLRAVDAFRYNRRVFIAPPWREIFHPDAERKQDFNEAVRTYEMLVATYTAFGYELVELPRTTIEDRVQFVLEGVGQRDR